MCVSVRGWWSVFRGTEWGSDTRASGGWLLWCGSEGYADAYWNHHQSYKNPSRTRWVCLRIVLEPSITSGWNWVLKVFSLYMRRWEGKENQRTYLGGSEEIQVSREQRWTLRRESQQQGTLRYSSGWVSSLQAPRGTCGAQVQIVTNSLFFH